METELVRTFNPQFQPIGVATRKDVHVNGWWHETFQCWFVSKQDEEMNVYLQLRSFRKKDFANLFDITAAGHILANETVEDGVREVKEELGINISFNDLIPLGVIPNQIKTDNIKDNEFSHVFLYIRPLSWENFLLQEEEVAGIAKAKMSDFCKFFNGTSIYLEIEGFEMKDNGEKVWFQRKITKQDFVPHSEFYFSSVSQAIQRLITVD